MGNQETKLNHETIEKRLNKNLSDQSGVIKAICTLVSAQTGVQLGQKELPMVRARLKKRALFLGYSVLEDYFAYFRKHTKSELTPLISLLTTHHTSFFREFQQFEHLSRSILPELIVRVKSRSEKTVRVWSTGCSRGQEVYSLAMFLDFHLSQMAPELDFQILGTDVDEESIAIAKNGVYQSREIKEVPLIFLSNHWTRGTGAISEFVRVGRKLRSHCSFDTVNMLSLPNWSDQRRFDLVFCRNVFIYFSYPQIKVVASDLLKTLDPSGHLFIGIAESINGLGLDITPCGPSVYRFKNEMPATKSLAKQKHSGPIRVMCVDDSPTVQALMKLILRKDLGFEIVATANNGNEARQKLKLHKPDVITLDIHMPEEDGIEYLRRTFGPDHPPVVMVSSVSREDAILTLQAIELGASDYVEKPALDNLSERGEEIRMKLKCVMDLGLRGAK
ncbi:MAG: CheR family methyltransferase [Bdellovibrionia bacterium]